MYKPYLVYPFICRWTPWLPLAIVNNAAIIYPLNIGDLQGSVLLGQFYLDSQLTAYMLVTPKLYLWFIFPSFGIQILNLYIHTLGCHGHPQLDIFNTEFLILAIALSVFPQPCVSYLSKYH